MYLETYTTTGAMEGRLEAYNSKSVDISRALSGIVRNKWKDP